MSNAAAVTDRTSGQRVLRELVGYAIAASLGLLVDVGLLKALVDMAGWHYLSAAAVAFTAAVGVTYFVSVRFVFQSKGSGNRCVEFLQFAALGVVGLLINLLVLSVGVGVVGLQLLAAKAIATICAFVTNFVLRRRLLS